jgi:hypothetical protein
MNQWFIPLPYFRKLINVSNCCGVDSSVILSRSEDKAIVVSTFGLISSIIGKLVQPLVFGQDKVYVTDFDIVTLREFLKRDSTMIHPSLEKLFHFRHDADGNILYPVEIMCNLGNVIMPSSCEHLGKYIAGMYINDTIYSTFLADLGLDASGVLKYMTQFRTSNIKLFGDNMLGVDQRIAAFERCSDAPNILMCDHGFGVTGTTTTHFNNNLIDFETDNVIKEMQKMRFLDSDEFE